MNKKICIAFISVLFCTLSSGAYAQTKTVTVWGWGGPETDLRCDKMADWGLLGKHCVAHSVIHKQHKITLTMNAPKTVNINQVVDVKNACKVAADVAALALGFSIPAAIVTLEACIASTNIGAHLIKSGATFSVGRESGW